MAEAKSVLIELCGQSPPSTRPWLLYGIVLARMGENQRASETLERYLIHHPDSLPCLNWLSIVSRRARSYQRALELAEKASRLSPKDPESHNNLGLSLLALARPSEAIEHFQLAAQAVPQNAQFRHNLGLAYQAIGRDAESAQCFRAAIQLSPDAIPSYVSLGGLMLLHGAFENALESARVVLSRDPTSPPANFLAAQALTNLSEPLLAEEHIRNVLRVDPENSIALGMLGFKLQNRGEFEEGERAFRKSLTINPLQGISYWGVRQGNKAQHDDLAEAPKLFAMLDDERFPPTERFFLLFALAKTYADSNRYEEAMKHYDLANEAALSVRPQTQGFKPEEFALAMRKTRELLSQDFVGRHQGIGSESSKPIFIVGMMRSGTTLMEQIVSSHPQVTAGGELRFWLEKGPKVVDLPTQAIVKSRSESLISDYLVMLNRIDPNNRVTDKMPQNLQVLGLIHVLFPNAKVIIMNRNPIENCLSIYITPYEMPPEFAHDKANIVSAYRENEKMTRHWREVLPAGSFLDVQYEELVDNSEVVIRQVLDYCELEWDESCLHHTENRRVVSTPSVWQVRQPIYRSSVERWRHYEPWLGPFLALNKDI